jgi:hypothetical protein
LVGLAHDGWTTSAMDRAIHAATTCQATVCGIDDCVDLLLSDITLHQLNGSLIELHLHCWYSTSIDFARLAFQGLPSPNGFGSHRTDKFK